MTYGTVNGVGKPVARIVHGTTMLATDALEQGMDLLDGVFAAGGTTFDSAWNYGGGECERVLGAWMERRGNRGQVVIITKGCHHNQDRDRVTPADLTSDLMDSLIRLRTDYVDLYLLHRDDPSLPVDAIVATMAEHHAAGRIHAYGGSNWSVPRIEEANAYAARHGLPAFAASSPNYSLAVQLQAPWAGCLSIGGPEAAEDRDWYRRTQLPVFSWSSLAGGFFSGRFGRDKPRPDSGREELSAATYCSDGNFTRLETAQAIGRAHGVSAARVALAYIMQTSLDVYPIAASATPGEFADNAAALELELSFEEIGRLRGSQPD
ncbi:MAG: aldo/keto reductase [Spirochaetaceae bacterium]|nr:aldo/keto reductase [Spirochaetaceae bacterium]